MNNTCDTTNVEMTKKEQIIQRIKLGLKLPAFQVKLITTGIQLTMVIALVAVLSSTK